ncbi:MAG TPA: hypothetical protein DEG17_12165 [Cyanobacteria bacterium UBA11149]|nr:hypothetical protein [Cyanobacteria bacterium UBA11367]HBE60544.1 hypothetical protein [Cyanobacteria bacterium UBA11366]HBK63774.1 hypothetical protein [Cyanobacteria bacterium UBA11166]HBR72880.1 hypothetical protein [Cyanobacteria bacterium UBA11159]HBS68993.1 hypothetical protein [Cyanobacteria bacterium UBA11153]HBW89602.1 hypothetical protein [Cyanobacteria bacterium UBA11149]HCA93383.1 hypothetical protein [Cyanobacteria bacterium UBA9226]
MDWIVKQIQSIFDTFSQLLTTKLFEFGGKPFSLSTLVQLIFLILIALLIARTVSEWMKRKLLVRFKFDRGSREAIGSVTNYVLAIIGFFIILQSAGINLSSLTVVAGALGIGLGFGFQNLASNFISGVTLLFDQPIKVGDFIEVDSLLGTVEKISIRSTIVRTLDGVSAIVPNNRFIENNIINWSYQDPKCRIHIPVGVAHNSEPILVTEALLEAAHKESRVLSNPAPKVWFKRFGEEALEFELLVWIDNPPETDPITSTLNFLIEAEFRDRSIEIALPQRDVYIRNVDAIATLLQDRLNSPDVTSNMALPTIPVIPIAKKPPKSLSNWTLRDLLRRISYFEKSSDLELRDLIEYGYRQLFPTNQLICQENEPGDSFYLILSGSVEVFSQRAGKYIATLHEGEFFGEISVLMGTTRSASVRTLEDTILFVVERNELQKLLMNHRQLADQIAEKLSQRQQSLRDLGLLVDEAESEQTPLERIRKRITTIFGI